MNNLFEQIDLKPFTWIYRRVSNKDFQGFYHWHQGCELLFVYKGNGRVIVDQHTYDIKRGMLFFFQPFQLHRVYVEVSPDSPYERSILHFDPLTLGKNLQLFPGLHTLLSHLQNSVNEPQAFDLENYFFYIYESFEAFNHSLQTSSWEEDSQLLLMQILSCIRLNDKQPQDVLSPHKGLRTLNHSERIMQWVEAHYSESLDLGRLSDELHLSKTYVSKVFKRETGSNITEYVTIRRIKQACQLLQMTSHSVEYIGESVGFNSVSYFIYLFKKMIGITPHQFRISQQKYYNKD